MPQALGRYQGRRWCKPRTLLSRTVVPARHPQRRPGYQAWQTPAEPVRGELSHCSLPDNLEGLATRQTLQTKASSGGPALQYRTCAVRPLLILSERPLTSVNLLNGSEPQHPEPPRWGYIDDNEQLQSTYHCNACGIHGSNGGVR